MPVPGIPTVVCSPFSLIFTVAPLLPIDTLEIPFLLKFNLTPGSNLILFLNLNPIILIFYNYILSIVTHL